MSLGDDLDGFLLSLRLFGYSLGGAAGGLPVMECEAREPWAGDFRMWDQTANSLGWSHLVVKGQLRPVPEWWALVGCRGQERYFATQGVDCG